MPIIRNTNDINDINVIDISGSNGSSDPEDDSLGLLDKLVDKSTIGDDIELFPIVSEIVPSSLNPLQVKVLASLLETNTYKDAAKLAGCSAKQVGRYMKDPVFLAEYNRLGKLILLEGKAAQVHKELMSMIKGKDRNGKAQAINTYYKLVDMIKPDSVSVVNNNSANVYAGDTIPLDKLPTWLKLVIIKAVQGATISRELENRIINELSEGLTLNGSNVNPEYMLSEEEEEHETGTNDIHLISANDYHDSNDDNVNDNNSGMLF